MVRRKDGNHKEIKELSADELQAVIEKGLYVNENCDSGTFKHKKTAEYLECAMYVCPYCGLSEFESHNDIITCKKCHREIRYSEKKELTGISFSFPFRYVGDWYDYQNDYINKLDITPYADAPVFKDEVSLFNVIFYKKKELINKNVMLVAFNDRFELLKSDGNTVLSFEDVFAVSVLGRNKLNIYFENGKKAYQIKGNKRFNALKYINFYYHCKNIREGNTNGKFLGL